MDKVQEVAFCGLYCGLCASQRRIPQQAATLRQTLCQEGYDRGYFTIPGLETIFAAFWEGLNRLADEPCLGCQAGWGNPDCAIRDCAQKRGVVACPTCRDYPCEKLNVLRHYPLHAVDSRRMQAVGVERWISEQEERARHGFAYADIRLPEKA